MTRVSRRRFVALSAAAAATTAAAPRGAAEVPAQDAARLSVQAVLERVKARIGVPWRDDAPDRVVAGHPVSLVSGIVTTALPTLDVLRQAVAAGANLIVTPAPVFHASADANPPAPDDPVLAAKRAFLEQHGLVVFHLARHWHLRMPDPRATGLASRMGWTGDVTSHDALRYDLAPRTLETLARDLTARLNLRGGLRAIGDRALPVRRIGLLPGVSRIEAAIALLPEVDAIVAGEVWEWETAAYVQDVVYAGLPKGFVSIGRVVSEGLGMEVCADWLTTVVPEVPVRYIAAGDPYWRPS